MCTKKICLTPQGLQEGKGVLVDQPDLNPKLLTPDSKAKNKITKYQEMRKNKTNKSANNIPDCIPSPAPDP